MSDTTPAVVATFMNTKGDAFLLMTEEDTGEVLIRGFENETAGVRYFEDGFRRATDITAVLYNATFQPRVHVTTVEALTALLGADHRLYEIAHMTGRLLGLQFPDTPEAKAFRERGIEPRVFT